MKGKIISILVMMLLIISGTIVVADWEEGDGHKMHWPQLPDPNGWDVDWGTYYLGDDWECNETGNVSDIHFWYSWYHDMEWDIPYIDVSIWSNNDSEPSKPLEELWDRRFDYPDDFKIAGPWNGTQGWYIPQFPEYEPDNHYNYYQINIMGIVDDPFKQVKGEIYWLTIKMPFSYYTIGWKTSISDQFMDTAVWGSPTVGWTPFYDPENPQQKLDLAFVITENEPPIIIEIDGPEDIIVEDIVEYNIKAIDPDEDPISYYIDWGDGTNTPWGPFQASGEVYTRSHAWSEQGNYIIRVKAKDIYGAESDWEELEIKVPRNKAITNSLFYHLLEQFPILKWLFHRFVL